MGLAIRLLAALTLPFAVPSAFAQCTTQWLPGLGGPGVNGEAARIARWDPDGPGPLGERIVVAGSFSVAGNLFANRIASWDPATGAWSALGTGMNFAVMALAALPNGDLVAGGTFTIAGGVACNHIARWNGTSWSPLARWNGANWSPMAGGVNAPVEAMAIDNNGVLHVGGSFVTAGGQVGNDIARLATTCPAAVAVDGAGCSGSAGPEVLAATTLPWVGATFRSSATGMPANSIVLGVWGLTGLAIPLTTILPQSVPGCTLLVSTEAVEVHFPVAGMVAPSLVIPNTVTLAGAVVREQVVPVELDGLGNITAMTSSNALVLTIGSL